MELKSRELVASLLKDFDAEILECSEDVEDWGIVGEEQWDYE